MLLVCDDNDLPNWYPADLFSISDARVSPNWLSAMYPGNDDGLQFILGYERLVSDELHYDALLERDPSALELFRLEKMRHEPSSPATLQKGLADKPFPPGDL